MDQIKSNPDIDAVYVITLILCTNHLVFVANAGKHVICEKPMALNAKEAKDMIDACNQNKVKLLIGYRMHFEPKTLEIVRISRSGEAGKTIVLSRALRIQESVIPLNGVSMQSSPEVDPWWILVSMPSMVVRYMLGEEPTWVTAQETKTDKIKFKDGVDETITFQMSFPSGATASCLSTYNMNGLDKFYLSIWKKDLQRCNLPPVMGLSKHALTKVGWIYPYHPSDCTDGWNGRYHPQW